MKYTMTNPCGNCPFRTDVEPYLTPQRVQEIADSLVNCGFPCHETVTYGDDGEPVPRGKDEIHCAGALILLEAMEYPGQMMRIAFRLGMYDPSKLNMDAPVFDDWDGMIDAQVERGMVDG